MAENGDRQAPLKADHDVEPGEIGDHAPNDISIEKGKKEDFSRLHEGKEGLVLDKVAFAGRQDGF